MPGEIISTFAYSRTTVDRAVVGINSRILVHCSTGFVVASSKKSQWSIIATALHEQAGTNIAGETFSICPQPVHHHKVEPLTASFLSRTIYSDVIPKIRVDLLGVDYFIPAVPLAATLPKGPHPLRLVCFPKEDYQGIFLSSHQYYTQPAGNNTVRLGLSAPEGVEIPRHSLGGPIVSLTAGLAEGSKLNNRVIGIAAGLPTWNTSFVNAVMFWRPVKAIGFMRGLIR